ncbi:MAG: GntR family transcriptional regulator [Burkholderiales bacterium]|nr:GntR family transcriptional regulator [Burkholderiales bacterium]
MDRAIKPLDRPVALADQVYQTLREQLRTGRIGPSQRLQEVMLATQLGVSRTPVREALARLASEGLVEADGRGFAVPGLTPVDVDDIYAVRGLLEPEAMRHAARRAADGAARAPLEEALAEAEAAHAAGDADRFIAANGRFREAWIALVANRRLVRAIGLYADHVRYLRALTLADPAVRAGALAGMREIAQGLRAGDADAAARAMRAQLERAQRALLPHTRNEAPAAAGK